MARIAVDAMGGDHGAAEAVAGALDARGPDREMILVGDEDVIRPLLDDGPPVTVVHAPEIIDMGEDPRRAIREKKGTSISVAARLVADGEADALVSSGSTGATVAAAALIIGRLRGVMRPAIANMYLMIPSGGIVVLDSGANVECKPEHLYQFGVMGTALAQIYLDAEDPRVGILNIGEEEGKGRDLEKGAYELLKASSLNFVGNLEGNDVAHGVSEVFVTDGFTGNVLLKAAEGVATFTAAIIADLLLGEASDPETIALVRPKLMELRAKVDPEVHGGAHLVGTKGVVVIGHGAFSRRGIAASIDSAVWAVEQDLVGKIAAGLDA